MHSLEGLNRKIVECQKCERLSTYIREVARKKVRRYADWEYWGKPLPGFGDPEAKLLIVGLAPAAHGGNRTGRMFTGDSSGDWLAKALYETGFANKPTSESRDDGLELKDAYITAVVRCAPPENKPTKEEMENCNGYLVEELKLLKNVKVILCLGSIALKGTLMALKDLYPEAKLKGIKSGRGLKYKPEGIPYTLITSYHPSKQNTQTGRLKWEDWIRVFEEIKSLLEGR
ncbi:uracil-DNA glycosylase family 4 [Hydrogenivirga caldilitoris]|uniref:Type-5 uracil-DNA glycosylase n=1 Tax=Hydrogenivirga caldilitoris TaxID=246264 RepID=A0A497XRF9_9AQUI|nr:uracil-DNA glycosylase [Hydrogenivirga caldilitoris]RLJ70679.1 uracil-DNA glycosylase family 4 [Hydrogenivirga caldilitoris]